MGGMRKEIFGGVGGEWRAGASDGEVGGDVSEMGSVTEEGKQQGVKRYRCQPQSGLQG